MTDSGRAAHDSEFMRRALDLARKGWGHTAPNPMVGAVVVRDGRVVGEGYHERFGEAHAEVNAIRAAGDMADGATLYVTLEPCRHQGKTPPCTDAVIASGIERVVIAAADPTPQAGGGADVLRAAGIETVIGTMEREARDLNAPFFHQVESDLPWTTLKVALSQDLAIANDRGTATWLTSNEARVEVHRLRAGQDAIAVGVGTILADDPHLTVRYWDAPRKPPARVVFDRSLRTPLRGRLVATAREAPVVIVTQGIDSPLADMFRDAGVHLIAANDMREGLRKLRAAGIRALLIEGGATINRVVMEERLVDRLIIIQAPVTLGPGSLPAFEGATETVLRGIESCRIIERRSLGPDVMTTYALGAG